MGIRVAMVVGSMDARYDGVADYAGRLARALGGAGVDVTPVVLTSLAEAGQRIRDVAPDVVHVQFAAPAAAARRLPAVLDPATPLVTTVHEDGDLGDLVPASAVVVVTNAAHRDALRSRTGTEARLIPLAPNVSRRHHRDTAGDGPVLAFFGYVHPVKGVRYLLDALALLRDRRPTARLLVIGGFTSLALPAQEARRFRDELTTIADRRGIADRVRFTGYLPPDEVSALLSTADIGVLPFTQGVTTKSGALLTLLAHGLPTVVTAAGDPALVDGDQVCVVREHRDGRALADAVDRLLGDSSLRDRLTAAGLRFARTRTWDGVATAHRELYEHVVAGA
jgi:glycosyltransferase involved in cell wall biosynthesis